MCIYLLLYILLLLVFCKPQRGNVSSLPVRRKCHSPELAENDSINLCYSCVVVLSSVVYLWPITTLSCCALFSRRISSGILYTLV